MKILVTGGAGFIGSHAADALIAAGHDVTVIDNLSGGKKDFISHHAANSRFHFIRGDLLDADLIKSVTKGQEEVWHFAAKPDVKTYTTADFEKDVAITTNLLEAMRQNNVKRIVFSSSSTVYGEAEKIPTPENAPLKPISLYGESKVACEALISEYCARFDMQSRIFRFANVIGERGTHGVIVDFINKLRKNPSELEILGDGKQSKSYLLVNDCVNGMLTGIENASGGVNVFNLGCEDWISVRRIAEIVSEEMDLQPASRFTGGERGWVGDVPKMRLAVDKIKAFGWKAERNSEEAVREAAKALLNA